MDGCYLCYQVTCKLALIEAVTCIIRIPMQNKGGDSDLPLYSVGYRLPLNRLYGLGGGYLSVIAVELPNLLVGEMVALEMDADELKALLNRPGFRGGWLASAGGI